MQRKSRKEIKKITKLHGQMIAKWLRIHFFDSMNSEPSKKLKNEFKLDV